MKKWQKITGGREYREHERTNVLIRARMITATGETRVFVRNLSCGGAMIDTNQPAQAGDSIRLCCGDLAADAVVAWVHDTRLGLRFVEPVHEDLITRYVRKRAA